MAAKYVSKPIIIGIRPEHLIPIMSPITATIVISEPMGSESIVYLGRPRDLRGLHIADCVDAVLAHLPPDGRVILVGHSLGAAVALVFVGLLGGRLAHLVLIAGPVPAPANPFSRRFRLPVRLICRVVLRRNPVEFSQSRRIANATLLNGLPRWSRSMPPHGS